MYESHFGLSGSPFGLNPDPAFYFGSRGHSSALSYLKFGVYQGEGFVVVTGEIGAGKTTLVRTLLAEVDPAKVVAAQIVSTQLEAGELLRSVAIAFGLAPRNLTKAELLATIEAFLITLVTQNRRALLIVDEAQNLNREAVEELRMLSNFQLGNRALLQSFLVGQPELRTLLTSKPMEQFRQRVIASCHLGPMNRAETQSYIEHRLKHVGWSGRPSISEGAFDRIFAWSGGIPRRVNLLCNRLLLSAFLGGREDIDAELADAVGEEIRTEVGEAHAPSSTPQGHAPLAPREPAEPLRSAPATPSARTVPEAGAVARAGQGSTAGRGVLFVAASALDDVKLALLAQALQRRHAGTPALRVRIGDPEEFTVNDAFLHRAGVETLSVQLPIDPLPAAEQIADVLAAFAPLLVEEQAGTVVVVGASDAALACGLAAAKSGARLVHIEAGARADGATGFNARLIERMADLLYPVDQSAYVELVRDGADKSAEVVPAGQLLVDVLHRIALEGGQPEALLQQAQRALPGFDVAQGYGVVAVANAMQHAGADAVTALLDHLESIGRDTPLVWPMPAALREHIDQLGLMPRLERAQVACIAGLGLAETVALMQGARVVVADGADMLALAGALRVGVVTLDPQRAASGTAPSGEPAAERIAEHLAARLGEAAPRPALVRVV